MHATFAKPSSTFSGNNVVEPLKPDVGRAPAQRLDANRSRTSVEVHKAAASDSWRQDIEQSFSQSIACRTGLKTTWGNQLTGAIRSCNDAHLSMV